jgi:ABC-type Fe3+ transport system permease subunit
MTAEIPPPERGQVPQRRQTTDVGTRAKIAGVVVLAALAAAGIGIVVFATLWLALLIGLFTLFVALPIAVYSTKRRLSGSRASQGPT